MVNKIIIVIDADARIIIDTIFADQLAALTGDGGIYHVGLIWVETLSSLSPSKIVMLQTSNRRGMQTVYQRRR